jgi:hypothetical protein
MYSIEFIQSIDWPKYGLPRRMRAIQPVDPPPKASDGLFQTKE